MRKIEYVNSFFEKRKKKKFEILPNGTQINSQNGEDFIFEVLLEKLGLKKGWLCEFGAWDGKHLSNTFNLVKKGFKAVYIEGDKAKFNDLMNTVKEYPNIVAINAYVDHNDTENSLDNLLKRTDIPIDFDAVSIDIDSYDYQVWKSLKIYRPKLVCIEINSSIDPLNEVHIHGPGYQGTSFMPTYNLGIEKGYTFLFHTGNMFFVVNELADKLNIRYNHYLENFRKFWYGSDKDIIIE